MELTKKTTILFPPDLHDHLSQLARHLGLSLGELVRRACEAQYRIASRDDRLAAVRELEAMALPVGDPDQMKHESMPSPGELLP
ncbi:MAG: allophanate hydrolase subunit 1 [bacterium]|nr:allophanate hydrolase subunit 1 [bacterium]